MNLKEFNKKKNIEFEYRTFILENINNKEKETINNYLSILKYNKYCELYFNILDFDVNNNILILKEEKIIENKFSNTSLNKLKITTNILLKIILTYNNLIKVKINISNINIDKIYYINNKIKVRLFTNLSDFKFENSNKNILNWGKLLYQIIFGIKLTNINEMFIFDKPKTIDVPDKFIEIIKNILKNKYKNIDEIINEDWFIKLSNNITLKENNNNKNSLKINNYFDNEEDNHDDIINEDDNIYIKENNQDNFVNNDNNQVNFDNEDNNHVNFGNDDNQANFDNEEDNIYTKENNNVNINNEDNNIYIKDELNLDPNNKINTNDNDSKKINNNLSVNKVNDNSYSFNKEYSKINSISYNYTKLDDSFNFLTDDSTVNYSYTKIDKGLNFKEKNNTNVENKDFLQINKLKLYYYENVNNFGILYKIWKNNYNLLNENNFNNNILYEFNENFRQEKFLSEKNSILKLLREDLCIN